MKIQVISDLHQEFGFNEFNYDDADVLVLAGDIHLGTKGIEWILEEIKNIPVVYILGNHEYYKGSYPKTLNKIKNIGEKSEDVFVLENETCQLKNVTFHGATLWTDFQLFGNPRKYGIICQGKMNDYRKIRRDPSYSKLRTIDTFNIHMNSIRWLEDSLKNTKTDKNVVVTHHAPSIQSIPDQYRQDPVTSAYASNLEALIEKYQPEYWIHGHIHTPVKYEIGNTKVVCNPHGYIDEKYNGYDPELIIEL
ncbi:metallophosphoesterase [Flammeovirga sp. OC4]|uniref:metallophosphoesterase n=1 Tax=Flammeovirga sp. OC4 TaxID=1382345 RepID=UPI0005C53229|nr:metallophosphoesterase [Flammeovirga sp. OC4]